MENSFLKVKNYLLELGLTIVEENENENVLIIENEEEGISNMILICSEPILIMEQFLFEMKSDDPVVYKSLLQKKSGYHSRSICIRRIGNKSII